MATITGTMSNVSDPNQRWLVLKQPDGTYLSRLATGTAASSSGSFTVTLPGIYELVHVVNDPGNVSAPGYTLPTYIPLPTGTNFATTARMQFFSLSTLSSAASAAFGYATNFAPYNCSVGITNPNTNYFLTDGFGSVFRASTTSSTVTRLITTAYPSGGNRNLIYDPINKAFIFSPLTDTNYWMDATGAYYITLRYNNTLGAQSSLSNYDMTTDGNGYFYWNTGENNLVVIDARSQTSIYWLKQVMPDNRTEFDIFGSGISMSIGLSATNTIFYYKGMLYVIPTLSGGQIYEVNPSTGDATLAFIDTSSFTTARGGDGLVIINDVAYISNAPQATILYKVPLTFPFVPNQVFTASLVGNNAGFYGAADVCQPGVLINTNQSKSVSASSALLGNILTYTVYLRNVSVDTITNVVLNDTIPPETTFVPGSLTINGEASSSTPTTATLPNLAIGSSVTVTFQAIVTSIPSVNPITNTANINYILDSVPNTATTQGASTVIGNTPSFSNDGVLKSVDKTSSMVGDVLTYTITIANSGTATALTPIFTDAISPYVTLVNSSILVGGVLTNADISTGITLPNLSPGTATTITFKVAVTSNPPNLLVFNQGNLNYEFVVNSQTLPGSQSSNIVSTVILTSTGADLGSSIKYGPNTAYVGQTITYTFIVSNSGGRNALNTIMYDTLPSSLTFVSNSIYINGTTVPGNPSTGINIGTIPSNGGAFYITLSAVVNTLPDPNTILNVADFTYTDSSSNPLTSTTNTIPTQIMQVSANLNTLSKLVDDQTPAVGTTITFTISIPNTGGLPATNVVVLDTLPVEFSYVSGSATVNGNPVSGDPTNGGIQVGTIPAGTTDIVKFIALVNTIPSSNPYTNIANVGYNDGNGNTTTIPAVGPVIFVLSQGIGDLSNSLKFSSNPNPSLGETITYAIYAINSSATTVTNLIVYDTLPNGLDFVTGSTQVNGATVTDTASTGINGGTVPGGQYRLVTFKVVLNTVPNPNPYTNTADLRYFNGTNTITSPVSGGQINVSQPGAANIGNIEKGANAINPRVGDIVTYTITIPNISSIPATNVALLDVLPNSLTLIGTPNVIGSSGTPTGSLTVPPGLNIGTIYGNSTALVSFRVLINTIPSPNPYVNTVTITYTDPKGNYTLPSTGGNIDVSPSGGANISGATKGNNLTSATVGQIITYTLTLPNTGLQPAGSVTIVDILPTGLVLSGTPIVFGASGPITGNLTSYPGLNIGTIPASTTATLTFNILVNAIPNPSTFINTATVSYTDNNGTTTIPVSGPNGGTPISPAGSANISSATKGANLLSPKVGDTVTYTITIPNTSSIPATNVTLLDILPSSLTLIGPPTIIGASGIPSGSLTVAPGLNIGTIYGNSTALVIFQISANTIPSPNPYVNTVTINYIDPSGTHTLPATGGSINVTAVNGANIGGATKGNNLTSASVGQTITYTLTIPNTGNQSARNITIVDILPTGLVLSGVPVVTGSSGPISGNLTSYPGLNIGTIPASTTARIVFNILVNAIPNPSIFINTATVSYTDNNGTSTIPVSGPMGGTQINPAGSANIGGTLKGASSLSPKVGDTVTYTITIPNTSSIPATNVTVIDILPSALTLIGTPNVIGSSGTISGNLTVPPGLNIGSIGGYTTALITFRVLINTIPNPNPYVNTATISYSDSSGTHTLPSTGGNINVLPSGGANINSATKGNNLTSANIGQIITYTLTLPNTGNQPAGIVTIVDILPAGLVLTSTPVVTGASGPVTGNLTSYPGLNIGTIPGTTTATVTFNILVNAVPNPSVFINTATISYTDGNGTTTIPVTGPTGGTPISIAGSANIGSTSKGASNLSPKVGDTITYTITIPNTSSIPATNVTLLDILPSALTLIGSPSVIGSGGIPSGSLTVAPGLNIGTIGGYTTALVSFRVLINTIPSPNPYINTVTITYVDQTGSHTIPSTGGNLNVSPGGGANIGGATKGNNLTSATVGQTITYTLTLPNMGNQPAGNVTILDILPSGLILSGAPVVTGSSGPISGNLTLYPGLNIGTIPASTTATVSFNIFINAVPNPSIFINTATISYTDNNGSTTIPVTGPSGGTLITPSGLANLGNTLKSINNTLPLIGTIVNYTITIPNTGSGIAQNVTIYDSLTPGLTLVGTPIVTGATGTLSGNLTSLPGLNIGSIASDTIASITFQVLINTIPSPNLYTNQATISYTDTQGSRTFTTRGGTLIVNNLSITKTADKTTVNLGDTITYTFVISNNGTIPIGNINLFDTLPLGVTFVNGSFIGPTNTTIVSSDLLIGVNLGTIPPGVSETVSFKVVLYSSNCQLDIFNSSHLSYLYYLQPTIANIGTSNSNLNTVEISSVNFRQSYLDGMLTIPSQFPDIENISNLTVSSTVVNVDWVDSPVGISQEGQVLSGKKSVICSLFYLQFEYLASIPNQSVTILNYTVPACDYVVMSNTTDSTCSQNQRVTIEDIYYQRISSRQFFYNITYLIKLGS